MTYWRLGEDQEHSMWGLCSASQAFNAKDIESIFAVIQADTAPQLSCWIWCLYHISDTFYSVTINKHLFLYQKTLKKKSISIRRDYYTSMNFPKQITATEACNDS